jgi:hypothetical protein
MEPFPVMRLLLEGEMPIIPDKCSPLMQKLIARCWSMDPGKHPSFEDILNGIQAANFAIIPGADTKAIREVQPHQRTSQFLTS